jgi:hypothetical protein
MLNLKRIALLTDIMISKRDILLHIQPAINPYLIKLKKRLWEIVLYYL